ncbi:MAG: anaerobic ribonucleoside-triphosphate reductase activating protein [Oscillospiraceae bacterium]|nr:anaerobic ribonucleoside-triphosphate reductase activating protein [Oscillospiraceae bacterium]
MRIAEAIQDSIVDGPGFRFAIFTQGCIHNCPGCHNPNTHDITGGKEMTTDELIKKMLSNPMTDGLTLSGGDPFMQPEDCTVIARAAHENGLSVWTYTGYTYEELIGLSETRPEIMELLRETDVLIDGRFVLELRTLDCKWRGSTNQRLIDVKKSLAAGAAVTTD